MRKYRYIKAVIAGFCMAFIVVVPSMLLAETLRVLRGDLDAAINVPIGKTVLVESDTRVFEISTSSPKTADASLSSYPLIEVIGVSLGRATLTVLGRNGDLISNAEVLVVQNMPEFDETIPVPLPDMPAAEIILVTDGAASDTITLRSGAAVVVETDVLLAELEVGNWGIADAVNLTGRSIYLFGKTVGTTTLTLIHNDDQPVTTLQVKVTPNIDKFE